MTLALALREMTIEEKLEAMDVLWADLSQDGAAFESPAWHQNVLRERESRIAQGGARFKAWEQAKTIINNRTETRPG